MESRLPLSLWDTDYTTTKAIVDGLLVPVGFSAEAQTAIDLYTTPTAAEQVLIAAFVDSQVLSGNWNKVINFYTNKLATEVNSLTSMKGVRLQTNVGATFTTHSGFAYAGAEYLRTDLIGTDDLSQDDFLIGVGVLTSAEGGFKYLFGATDGVSGIGVYEQTTPRYGWISNTVTAVNTNNAIGAGFVTVERTAAAFASLKKNGALLANTTGASTGLITLEMYIGARNASGSPGGQFTGSTDSFLSATAAGFDSPNFHTNLVILQAGLALL